MQTKLASDTIEMICRTSPVITTPDIEDPSLAAHLARALTKGRLPIVEISIRGRNAAKVIHEMSKVPDAIVGAGMILSPDDVRIAREAGAKFCKTPGVTSPLLRYFDGIEMPVLPGVSTPTEAMNLLSRGYTVQNFFPGGSANTLMMLKAVRAPFPQLKFSISGEIDIDSASDYLGLGNVLNIASDFAAPRDMIIGRDWEAITALAREAAQLKTPG